MLVWYNDIKANERVCKVLLLIVINQLIPQITQYSLLISAHRLRWPKNHISLDVHSIRLNTERILFQSVCTADWALPGELAKDLLLSLPSFLYASMRCSSRSNCWLYLPRISIVRHNLNRCYCCLTARPSPMQELNTNEAIATSSDRPIHTS